MTNISTHANYQACTPYSDALHYPQEGLASLLGSADGGGHSCVIGMNLLLVSEAIKPLGTFSKHVATEWMPCPLSSGIILVARLAITGLGRWDTLLDVAESMLESMCGTAGITIRGWCSGNRISCIGCVCTSKEGRTSGEFEN
jgi:hypothetical protein